MTDAEGSFPPDDFVLRRFDKVHAEVDLQVMSYCNTEKQLKDYILQQREVVPVHLSRVADVAIWVDHALYCNVPGLEALESAFTLSLIHI